MADPSTDGGRIPDASAERRIRVLWNRGAGSKGGLSTNSASPEEMRELLEKHGLGRDLHETASPEDATALAKEAVSAGYEIVAAAGGDGTVANVATALLGTRTALGILPLGSVMNIGRMLGLPRDLEGAGSILAAGHVRAIDAGEANDEPFFEAGSVGMNAAIFREAQRVDEGHYGALFRGIRIAFRYRPARMRIELDDRRFESRAMMAVVANGPYSGLGLTVAPDARLDDGQFDVVVYRHYSKLDLIRHLVSLATGRRPYSPHVRTYRSASVKIRGHRPLVARADSRDLGTTPVEFRTLPRALRVVVPPLNGKPSQSA